MAAEASRRPLKSHKININTPRPPQIKKIYKKKKKKKKKTNLDNFRAFF